MWVLEVVSPGGFGVIWSILLLIYYFYVFFNHPSSKSPQKFLAFLRFLLHKISSSWSRCHFFIGLRPDSSSGATWRCRQAAVAVGMPRCVKEGDELVVAVSMGIDVSGGGEHPPPWHSWKCRIESPPYSPPDRGWSHFFYTPKGNC